MNSIFNLDKQLKADTIFIKDLELSQLLLMNDSNYPWFILVPRKNNISELFELSKIEHVILMTEISWLSKIIKNYFNADKINVANLGNIVTQLHIHIIARFRHDKAWPEPIWGKIKTIPYKENIIADYKRIFTNQDLTIKF